MPKNKLKVAAYCRVSTKKEEQLNSLKTQTDYYELYIKQNPNWTFVGVYSDKSSGLRTKNRQGYISLLQDCEKGKIDIILTKSLSRFGRDTLEILKTIRRLKKMNIAVITDTTHINTLKTSETFITIIAAIHEEESFSKSQNIKFGIKGRMKSGKAILNHSQFLGYTKGSDGVLKIVPEEAVVVRKIFDLYLHGNGVRKIKKHLEENNIKTVTGKTIWSTSTIDRILSNEKYAGNLLLQKTFTEDLISGKQVENIGQKDKYLVKNAHEPIISEDEFNKVQEIKQNKKNDKINTLL